MTKMTKPQAKHTRGPWTATADGYIQGPRGFGYLGKVYNDGFSRRLSDIQGTPEANARLMAAAPKLLESLHALTQFMEWADQNGKFNDLGLTKDIQAARAAIEEAEGK